MATMIEQTCRFCPEKLRFEITTTATEKHSDGSSTVTMTCQDTDGSVIQHYRDKHADVLESAEFKDWSIG